MTWIRVTGWTQAAKKRENCGFDGDSFLEKMEALIFDMYKHKRNHFNHKKLLPSKEASTKVV